jgi:CBS domain-containing protein
MFEGSDSEQCQESDSFYGTGITSGLDHGCPKRTLSWRHIKMKTISIREVYRLHGTAYEQVAEGVSLEEVVTTFACKPSVRAVFMIDARNRYAGIFSRTDLLRWAHIHVYGGKGRRDIPISEFYRLASAKVARDLARRDMTKFRVREDESLQTALDLLLDYEEDIIPVVDGDNKVIGDLRLSEILLKALEVGRETTV